MQNKPNPKNPKLSLTPYPKKNYAKTHALRPQKNKPNSNPIQPTDAPVPAQSAIPQTSPPLPNPQYAIRSTLHAADPQPQAAADQLCAKTQRNHHLIMQNKPNPNPILPSPKLRPLPKPPTASPPVPRLSPLALSPGQSYNIPCLASGDYQHAKGMAHGFEQEISNEKA